MTPPKFDLFFADAREREVQYNARATVADFDACMREYDQLAAASRSTAVGVYDLAYGEGRAERLDLFPVPSTRAPSALFIFIHGGYWRALTRRQAPIAVRAFTERGIAVAMLEYTLLPEATLAEVVREVRSATAWLYRHATAYGIDSGRIFAGGSSAGGHLAGMLAASGWQDEYGLPADAIKGMLGLSGLYDLRPLCDIAPNAWLRLEPAQAQRLSPLFALPRPLPMVLATGGKETLGFTRQTLAYADACRARGANVKIVAAPDCNHFNLLSELGDPTSALSQAAFALMAPAAQRPR